MRLLIPPQRFVVHGCSAVIKEIPLFAPVISAPSSGGRIFRSEEAAVRKETAVLLIKILCPQPPAADIIISRHIERIFEGAVRPDRCRRTDIITGRGDHAGRILPVAYILKPLKKLHSVSGRLLRDLIADAPDNDTGMIVIPSEHGDQILLRVLIKEQTRSIGGALRIIIADFIFCKLPFVEDLIHDKESHLIAEIEQHRFRRIVRAAYAVAAHLLQLLKPALPALTKAHRSGKSAVMMYAHALDFDRYSIQQKAAVPVKHSRPDSDPAGHLIHCGPLHRHRTLEGVEIRIIYSPQMRMLHGRPHEGIAA